MNNTDNKQKVKMRPVLDGDYWMIGDNPDLGELNGNTDLSKGGVQECVDHHIFRADDGQWHLWGCIRGTAIGRLLYHWQADRLTTPHWQQTGEILRADSTVGENVCHLYGQEWLQSPYIIREDGLYYMFYGGHSTEFDMYGLMTDHEPYDTPWLNAACMRGQICLMTSADGLHWQRRLNALGKSRLFFGPGETRDPMVLKIGDLWYMYTAGAVIHHENGVLPQVYLRTSTDLLHWSDYQAVHYDLSVAADSERTPTVWTHECPFVVEHGGYYYLLRTENYAKQRTHVYRSEDPTDFGLGDGEAAKKYVGQLPVAAPEIIRDEDGTEYISSNHNLIGGTMLCKLRWERDA